jgi:hypothetical protein
VKYFIQYGIIALLSMVGVYLFLTVQQQQNALQMLAQQVNGQLGFIHGQCEEFYKKQGFEMNLVPIETPESIPPGTEEEEVKEEK